MDYLPLFAWKTATFGGFLFVEDDQNDQERPGHAGSAAFGGAKARLWLTTAPPAIILMSRDYM